MSSQVESIKLTSFGSEMLEEMSQFWTGQIIVRLYLTGDKTLINRMCSDKGVTRVVFEETRLKIFPPILAQFRSLRHLRIHLSNQVFSYYQDNFLLPYLPPSLEVLEIPSPFSVTLVSSCRKRAIYPPVYIAASTVLPNLLELEIQENDPREHQLHTAVEHFPDSLTRIKCTAPFDFSHRRDCDVMPFFVKLPRDLQVLDAEAKVELPNLEFCWPLNLTSLRLKGSYWTARPEHLPSNLTDLSLGLDFSSTYLTEDEQEDWVKKFQNIKTLRIATSHTYQLLQILTELNVDSLTLVKPMDAALSAHLPKSLRFLKAKFTKPCTAATLYTQLPRSLTSFDMKWLGDSPWRINNKFLSKLPQSLTHFNIKFCENLDAKFVPSLPPTLTSCPLLNSASVSPTSIASLPANLKELIFTARNSRLPLSDSDVALLPRNLQVLKFETQEHVLSNLALRSLPRKLLVFEHHTNTSFSGAFLSHLPSLTVLHLPSNSSVTTSAIGNLPRTLTELVLLGDESILTSACIKLLPPQMKRLHIRNIRGIDNENLKELPQTMKAINIPGPCLTNSCLPLFPLGITRITIRNNKSIMLTGLKKLPSLVTMLAIRGNPHISSLTKGDVKFLLSRNFTLRSDNKTLRWTSHKVWPEEPENTYF